MMYRQTYKPAFSKALETITNLITSGEFSKGDRLPSVRVLAKALHVNSRTVLAAIEQLRKDGVVAGKRAVVKAIPGECVEKQPAMPAKFDKARLNVAEKVHALLTDDITTGFYKPGIELPSIKELCARYSASSMTVRAVLEQLYSEQLLSLSRRRYCVRRYDFSSSLARIVLVGLSYKIEERANIIKGAHDESLIAHMSTLCSQMNIRLDMVRSPVE